MRADSKPLILAFAGSSRKGSYNRALLVRAAGFVEKAGGAVTLVELGDYPMPMMNEDLQLSRGIPETALKFKKLLWEHDGFLIASPEYNGFVTPLLKNSLDWASRSETRDEKPLSAFRGKTAAIVSASPGSLGGIRSLSVLRSLLTNLGVLVIPSQHGVSSAEKAFDDSDGFTDGRNAKAIDRVAMELVRITAALKAGAR